MERKAIKQIESWNSRSEFKPLLLNGARQVGKTWLMHEFAKRHYQDNYIYVNFEDDTLLNNVFAQDFDIKRIKSSISLIKGKSIDEKTLFLFDELQAAPKGLSALKYFHENEPGRRIIAAGSMLGLSIHKNDSFPVGKVEILDIYPMDFSEFLDATGNQALNRAIADQQWELLGPITPRIDDLLKTYYYVGGMPGVVKEYLANSDFNRVRQVQNELLRDYELDFSKHAPAAEVPRIRMIWQSVPAQLAKENRKFIYGQLRHGARAKDFELAIEWLKDAGLITLVHRVSTGGTPLKAFAEMSIFKIFLLDTGLLTAMCGLDASTILACNELFTTFKGALTEQYVCQQLRCIKDLPIFYWSANDSRGEIDFVTEIRGKLIPIEVKASENLQSKSLASFRARYKLSDSLRFSLSGYREQNELTNVPLWAVNQYIELQTIR